MMLGMSFVFSWLIALLLAFTGPEGAVGNEFPASADLHGIVVISCAWVVMWYTFLGNQVGVRFTEGLPAEISESAANIANRAVANTLEQAIPFLTLMWLEALFVNARTAQILGWIYVAARFLYPVFYGFYGAFTNAVEVSVQPGYIIIFYYLLTVFFKCTMDVDIHATITETSAWLMPLFLVGAKKDKGFKDPESEYEDEE